MRSVGVVTATRAEYGLLKNTIQKIMEDKDLELLLFVTGAHLSEKYGHTVKEIYEDGYPIAEEIPILAENSDELSITRAMGEASYRFGEIFNKYKIDMLVVLGDRYELLPICSCALIYGIPIAHISGGEVTEGAIDDSVRHAITKMSYLHFPGCEEYRKRIIQMGEEPERVFNYGDVGVENIRNTQFLTKKELEDDLDICLDKPYACVTFHPVTMEKGEARTQIRELLAALSFCKDMKFVITKANADAEGQYINEEIDYFVDQNKHCYAFFSVGIRRYLSLLKKCEMVIGNSSSGIVEAPCFGIPTINIGDRQKGRLKAESIIDCEPNQREIINAIEKAKSSDFRTIASNAKNPYGDGNTSEMIVKEIKEFFEKQNERIKHFYDYK